MALQIREYTYKGKQGYRLSGKPAPDHPFPVSIFAESREALEGIREKLKADPRYQTTLEDFE